MKRLAIYISVILFVGLTAFTIDKPCGETPEMNKKVIDFVNENMGKKVATGECWDVAAGALKAVGAIWDGNYNFGKIIDHKKNCVFPGDIIQFEGVELKYNIEDAYFIEKLTHHTAVIYKVNEKGDYVIADQNTKQSGKKVGTHPFNVTTITKGTFKIYRPQK